MVEAESPVGIKCENRPNEEEAGSHNLTHLPCRSWCPHCVRGRAVASAHHKTEASRVSDAPVVSMDYAFLKSKKIRSKDGGEQRDGAEMSEEEEEDTEEEGKPMPMLVMRDRKTKMITADVVPIN